MNTLVLALRNLLRNRRRSLTTLLAMVLGLLAVLLFGGYIQHIKFAIQTDFVRRSGHLQIQHRDHALYGSGNPAAYAVADYQALIAQIRRDPVLAPMVKVITPTLQFGGVAGNFNAGVSRTVLATGTVVEEQNRMYQWDDYGLALPGPRLSLKGTPEDSVVIGSGVARVLKLCTALAVPGCEPEPAGAPSSAVPAADLPPDLPPDIGDLAMAQASAPAAVEAGPPRIEILAASARGAPNVARVRVVKAEFQGFKELDDVTVALHLPQAQKLIFASAPPQVTAIQIQLSHTWQIPSARARLEALLAQPSRRQPLTVVDFETLNPFYGQTLSMFNTIFGFISVLIGGIVLFTVSNTMSMVVVERTAEIGTLRAIGQRRSAITTMFVTEGLVLGTAGAVLGVAMALGVAWGFNLLELTWVPPGRNQPTPLAVKLGGEYGLILRNTLGLMVVATLSAILPAARAARMNIVNALRHV